jgi:hypothetical protein
VLGPLCGGLSGLICGFVYGLFGGLSGAAIIGIGFAIIFAVIFTIDFALLRGGIACIQHYALRWFLFRSSALPWNAIDFLEYACERILLRRVGGGYMFSHRLLLEYFAGLEPKTK